MLRNRILRIALIVVLTLMAAGLSHAEEPQNLQQLSARILETLQSFYPVRSTSMGIHAYDHRFTDYSSKSVGDMIKKLNDYEKKLYKYKGARLSQHDQTNYQLLKSNVDMALVDLKRIEWHKRSPQLYAQETIDGIYFLVLSNHAPLSERLVSILNRMRAVPAFLNTARKNIKKPPPVYVELATETLESAIRFYKDVAAELSNKFPERADEISRISTQAREAMNDFMVYLPTIQPGSETSFAIGKDNFNYMLSNDYHLDFDSDSLLRLGENLLRQADSAYHEYLVYVENDHQNGSDSIFVPSGFNKQDILDYYNWEVNQLRIFLETQEIVTVPEGVAGVTVVETPSFMRTMMGIYAYQPAGPFDSIQHGYFYVRPIPDDLDPAQLEARYRYVSRRGFRGPAAHEAYPGHHFQMQLAGMNPDPVRKWQTNWMMVEGWALYCEEMMYRQGLYGKEDPASWLKILDGIRFRAARIVADVKLHTGQFTVDQCVEWMAQVMDMGSDARRDFLRTEVRRYTTTPTQQMSYLVGKLEIVRLLEAARRRDGDNFSLKDFHDALLAEGSIPPALMRSVMGLDR